MDVMMGCTWAYTWCCFCSLQAAIRKELNEFKSNEMEVHSSSKHLTRSAWAPCVIMFALFVGFVHQEMMCLRGSVWHCAETQRCIIQRFHISEYTPCSVGTNLAAFNPLEMRKLHPFFHHLFHYNECPHIFSLRFACVKAVAVWPNFWGETIGCF